jgi:hypothetical protein
LTARRRLVISLAGLAALYAIFIAAGDTRAWSGSDAGGKVATIRVMDQRHTLRPDVGYWAERSDPDGTYHPLIYTKKAGTHWLQVTSLPFIYLGLPLYKVAGTAGLLFIPAFGSLLAAYSARRLALAVGAAQGWGAFWLVGLGSPMFFYAADFWEHSAAVGLALLALALLFERRNWMVALVAGVIAGVAIVLRTEVLVYVAALGAGVMVVGEERREWLRRAGHIVAAGGGLVAVLVGNPLVERAVIGAAVRSTRASDQVASAGGGAGRRLSDGLLTLVGFIPDDTGRAYVIGVALVLTFMAIGYLALRRNHVDLQGRVVGAVAIALAAVRFRDGLGFIPGALPASPVSAAGLVGARSAKAKVVLVTAIVALPVVWLFQWQGQLVPQWGGRYVLLTGALLTVTGAVALEAAGWRRPMVAFLVGYAIAVSAYGVVWHAQRTRGVARAGAIIDREPKDEVIISGIAHLGRETGAFYGVHRWLNGPGRSGLQGAAAVAKQEGASKIAVVDLSDNVSPPPVDGYRFVDSRKVPFLGFRLTMWRYVAG